VSAAMMTGTLIEINWLAQQAGAMQDGGHPQQLLRCKN
jgi:hypothetical protein